MGRVETCNMSLSEEQEPPCGRGSLSYVVPSGFSKEIAAIT
jgi:hypothetical protein